jgi:hypothetical protein|tara:strand:+ start:4284 stop:4469 length:186 start_codon:yes stop_codon:yes gene_type:complete
LETFSKEELQHDLTLVEETDADSTVLHKRVSTLNEKADRSIKTANNIEKTLCNLGSVIIQI